MFKKHSAFLAVFALSSLLLGASISLAAVFGWSNGGYSDDPSNPDYGTHDWIAQHALDWLPLKEKQLILDNLASYLYGTELPDNGGAPDGIGDTTKHHVYYFANGSLQDDASAVRAQEKYGKAVETFKTGDLANAAKTLGIMTHYIADVAVFGHVMGSETDWGNEVHHSDYEDYVETRTNNYTDDFNTFLAFDGNLSKISAYNATLTLANDTTFDGGEGLTCVWMDENYNWSNPTFRSRCGESLNLAVNAVADVLHTFASEMQGVAHFITVPFHYQDLGYYCGPACLEMVFDYYGEDISQLEIADVARTLSPYGTSTDDLRRAAHFSNISTSMGAEIPTENITGYTLRKLGYAAFEGFDMDLTQLKSYIDQDKPLILVMWYSESHVYGHYRVAVGYNETHVFLHDPWASGGSYSGPNIALSYALFSDLWSLFSNWALYTLPWTITVSTPTYIKLGTPFQINATIVYPQALLDAFENYPALSCNATIILPANVSLALGETSKKTIGTGSLVAGASSTVSWMVTADSSMNCTIVIEAEGLISASSVGYPAYDYSDRIGAIVNFTAEFKEDDSIPLIGIPSRVPEDVVLPNQEVKVYVNVSDSESGVKNVTLYYNLNNSQTWTTVPMDYNSTSFLYSITIPGQPTGTYVKFKIVACDKAGNNATRDEMEYCAYEVIPEFPSNLILLLFMVLAIPAILYAKRKALRKTKL